MRKILVKEMLIGKQARRFKGAPVYFTVQVARMLDESETTMPVRLNTWQSTKTAMGIVGQALHYPQGTQLELWAEFSDGPLPMAPETLIKDFIQEGEILLVIPSEHP